MSMLDHPQSIVDRLIEFQNAVRLLLIEARRKPDLHAVTRDSAADTIYAIDAVVEPVLEAFCEEWGRQTPLVLIAEGLKDENGHEGIRTFPRGTPADAAQIRVIVDPIDGTRGLMYDKRSAWSLAGVAPNRGPQTRLRDVEVAVMTELPTSKMGHADVLWAVKGRGSRGQRGDLGNPATPPRLTLRPPSAT